MHVIDLTPRGYCHGVMNALAIVKKVIKTSSYPRPIFILGHIVHNQKITEAFKNYGVISLEQKGKTRLELLDEINEGTVIFTAHGISEQAVLKAKEKGLTTINATCRDVLKVHHAVKEKLQEGYKVIYIGHKNHPEPEAILAISEDIFFVENEKDVMMLPQTLDRHKLFVTNQTTLSLYDIDAVINMIETKYPHYLFDNEICHATTVRQDAVIKQDKTELMFVVGDIKSSNSNKLKEVGIKTHDIPAYLISSIEDIDLAVLKGKTTVSVTSGASTPTIITEEVITFLRNYDEHDEKTWDQISKVQLEDIL